MTEHALNHVILQLKILKRRLKRLEDLEKENIQTQALCVNAQLKSK